MDASPLVVLYPEKLTYGWTGFRGAGHEEHKIANIYDYSPMMISIKVYIFPIITNPDGEPDYLKNERYQSHVPIKYAR
jgi:hypothetical protein